MKVKFNTVKEIRSLIVAHSTTRTEVNSVACCLKGIIKDKMARSPYFTDSKEKLIGQIKLNDLIERIFSYMKQPFNDNFIKKFNTFANKYIDNILTKKNTFVKDVFSISHFTQIMLSNKLNKRTC